MPARFRPSVQLKDNDVTDEKVYRNRRDLLKKMGFLGAGALLSKNAAAWGWFDDEDEKKAPFKASPLDFSPSDNGQQMKR